MLPALDLRIGGSTVQLYICFALPSFLLSLPIRFTSNPGFRQRLKDCSCTKRRWERGFHSPTMILPRGDASNRRRCLEASVSASGEHDVAGHLLLLVDATAGMPEEMLALRTSNQALFFNECLCHSGLKRTETQRSSRVVPPRNA